jgi:hypothetical protein
LEKSARKLPIIGTFLLHFSKDWKYRFRQSQSPADSPAAFCAFAEASRLPMQSFFAIEEPVFTGLPGKDFL